MTRQLPLSALRVFEAAARHLGQGVALSLEPLAGDDLAAGDLVMPFGPRLPLEHAYHLLGPADAGARPAVARFREWLLAEAAEQRDQAVVVSETGHR